MESAREKHTAQKFIQIEGLEDDDDVGTNQNNNYTLTDSTVFR